MKRLSQAVVLALFAGLLSVLLIACGGGSSSSSSSTATESEPSKEAETPTKSEGSGSGEVEIDVGEGQVLKYPAGTKPKIGLFTASGTTYNEAANKSAEKAAEEYGVELTFFDSKFEPAAQMAQLQNALQSGEFNAWIIENFTGEAACNLVKKEAPAHNIAVVQLSVGTCGATGNPAGEEAWTPGTLATVGADQTQTAYEVFAREVAKLMRPDAEVALLNGLEGVETATELKEGVEKAGIEPVVEVNAEYTAQSGLAEMQTMLQAHPDINVLISIFNEDTLGATKAIAEAGKTGEIEVFDIGASKTTKQLIEKGEQTMSVPYYPVETAKVAVQAVVEAFEGKPTEHFYVAYSKGTLQKPFLYTKETLNEFEPQF